MPTCERRATRHATQLDANDAHAELASRRWRSEKWTAKDVAVNKLMGRCHVQTKSSLTADDFHRFFIFKVAKIRYSTVDAPEPSYNAVPPVGMFGYFRSIERDDVIKLIMSIPDKQCASDPIPTWLLKTCASYLAPFLCRLFNALINQWHRRFWLYGIIHI